MQTAITEKQESTSVEGAHVTEGNKKAKAISVISIYSAVN
jgi:hypothetical protein